MTESRRVTVGLVRGELRMARGTARRVARWRRLTPVLQQTVEEESREEAAGF